MKKGASEIVWYYDGGPSMKSQIDILHLTLRWAGGANKLSGAGAAELGSVQGEGEAGGGGEVQGEAGARAGCCR